ncbi:hypothetical protein HanRHA438_Chr07g0290881 [Helianthus annuus]|nr:hypothetical protein HanRHA438_Chr07g0290881 [Helianthus annuus]
MLRAFSFERCELFANIERFSIRCFNQPSHKVEGLSLDTYQKQDSPWYLSGKKDKHTAASSSPPDISPTTDLIIISISHTSPHHHLHTLKMPKASPSPLTTTTTTQNPSQKPTNHPLSHHSPLLNLLHSKLIQIHHHPTPKTQTQTQT